MIDETRVLFAEALKQPPEVRVAGTLIESLEGTVDERAEEFWAIEIRRRLDDLDAGVVKTVPWSEARRQILGR